MSTNFLQASRSLFQQEQIWAIQIELDLGWCQAQHCVMAIDRESFFERKHEGGGRGLGLTTFCYDVDCMCDLFLTMTLMVMEA